MKRFWMEFEECIRENYVCLLAELDQPFSSVIPVHKIVASHTIQNAPCYILELKLSKMLLSSCLLVLESLPETDRSCQFLP